MIYKTVTTKYRPFSMKTWHCSCKEMSIRPSYKDVKAPSPILGHVMFPHARDPGKDTIIILVRKHTTSANDKYHDLPYYVARIQRRKRYVKLRWFDQYFPDHEVIVEIFNPNGIHAFNRFEEEEHAEQKYNHFRLINLTREELYAMGVPASLMMRRNKIFHELNEIMKKLMSTPLMWVNRFSLIKNIRDMQKIS